MAQKPKEGQAVLESASRDEGERDAEVGWIKSSYCSTGGCVEVAIQGEAILVRDSKRPTAGYLSYSRREWEAFLAGAKRGEFDILD